MYPYSDDDNRARDDHASNAEGSPPFEAAEAAQASPPPPPSPGAASFVTGTAGSRRYTARAGSGVPRLTIGNISGKIQVRGDAALVGAIEVRALNDDGKEVTLEDIAEVTHTADGEFSVKVQPFASLQRGVRRVREAVNVSGLHLLENIGELVEAVSGIGRDWAAVNFEAVVPRECNVELTTASGEIEIADVTGEIQLRAASGQIEIARVAGNTVVQTASGEIEIEDARGAVYARTVSGEVTVERVDGNLVIQTASGDVEGRAIQGQLGYKSVSGDLKVGGALLRGLYLSTTSGDCAVEGRLLPGEHETRSVSGDLLLRLQPDFCATVSGRTVSGSFDSDYPYRPAGEPTVADAPPENGGNPWDADWDPLGRGGDRRAGPDRGKGKERRRGRGRWEFVIDGPGGGDPDATRLRVRTVSGDLRIKHGRGVPDVAGAASTAAEGGGADALAEMLERGVAKDSSRAGSGATVEPARARTEPMRGSWPDAELWPGGRVPEGESATAGADAAPDAGAAAPSTPDAATAQPPRRSTVDESPATAGSAEPDLERSRLEILQAVERKEISIDEAMLLLRELGRT